MAIKAHLLYSVHYNKKIELKHQKSILQMKGNNINEGEEKKEEDNVMSNVLKKQWATKIYFSPNRHLLLLKR